MKRYVNGFQHLAMAVLLSLVFAQWSNIMTQSTITLGISSTLSAQEIATVPSVSLALGMASQTFEVVV